MNKLLAFLIAAILVILGAYFWVSSQKIPVTGWDLVTSDAFLAYQYRRSSAGDPTAIFVIPKLPDPLAASLPGDDSPIISAHVVGRDQFGFVVYLPENSPSQEKFNAWLKSAATTERVYDGFSITECTVNPHHQLSSTVIGGMRIVGSSSLLIEDIIRLANNEGGPNFIRKHHWVFPVSGLKSDSATLYFDLSQLEKIRTVFLAGQNPDPLITFFGNALSFEMKKQKGDLILSGFAADSLPGRFSVLSTFNRQRPVPMTLQKFVSGRTSLLIHFGVSNFLTWNHDRIQLGKNIRPCIADSLDRLDHQGFDTNAFLASLGDEAGLVQSGFSGPLFLVEVKEENTVAKLLGKLDRFSPENYSHYQIHSLRTPSVPVTTFWPMNNHNMSYYLIADHHLIFSERLDDLKSFVNDLDNENTWGKTSLWNEFLSVSQDTNVGVIFDGPGLWPEIQNSLGQKWMSFLDSRHMNFPAKGSFQVSRLDARYYFNGVLRSVPESTASANGASKENVIEVEFPKPIRSGLTVVQNHNSKMGELLVHDEAGNLRLLSGSLKVLFTTKIGEPIRTKIHQIDYFNNRKLQYVFATDKHLFLVDRLGNMVRGFPKTISFDNPVQFLCVIDFDHNRNYRYLVGDDKSNMTLFDKDGNRVNDWKKNKWEGEIVGPLRAIKVRGKDYLVMVTREGRINALTRKGEIVPGFPVNLKVRPSGNWFVEFAGDRDLITVVSEDGLIIQVDLAGNIVKETSLPKASSTSKFSLVTTRDLGHYVFSRSDRRKIGVLDAAGNLIFETDDPGSEDLFLSYFELSRQRKIFSFTDPQQEFVYFFDAHGRSIFQRPLENSGDPEIIGDPSSGQMNFYCVRKNKIKSYRRLISSH